jgi:hypothetical protein
MKTLIRLFNKYAYVAAYAQLWLFIGFASAVDIYTSIKTQEYLLELERNPVGRWLIRQDDGGIALFMGVKTAGTTLALGILVMLYQWNKRLAWASIIGVVLMQIFVLWSLQQ